MVSAWVLAMHFSWRGGEKGERSTGGKRLGGWKGNFQEGGCM